MINYSIYKNHNSKEWVTFVHGAGGSSSIWFRQIKEFKKHFNVILLDLRGHGKSKYHLKNVFEKKYTFKSISNDIIEVLNKWKSKLKSGGTLRLAVPNFKTMAKLYIEKNIPLNNFLGPLYGKMKMGEDFIFHKTTYDFKELKSILNKCGFSDISYYDWRETEHSNFDDHSQAYIPHMDKDNGTLISLNVEATK